MEIGTHLCGGAGVNRRYKLGASVVNVGVPVIDGTAGVIPCTTTDGADTPGLGLDTGVYSTTQGDAEGMVTVSIRPDLVIKALMSGAATEGTALTQLVNTTASTTGATVTVTNNGTASMATGTAWCLSGANKGQSRTITTHNNNTSFVVTVPFLNDIPVGDIFLQCPWSLNPSTGAGNVQASTLFTQADATIVAGTGLVAAVVDLELNGTTDSYVLFVMPDHAYGVVTL